LDYSNTADKNLIGLKTKIESDIEHANGQMVDCPGAQKIVLFVIDLDSLNVRERLRAYLEEVDENHKDLKIVAGLQSHWRPQNSGDEGLEWLYDN